MYQEIQGFYQDYYLIDIEQLRENMTQSHLEVGLIY